MIKNSFVISYVTTILGIIILAAWLWQEILGPVISGTEIDFTLTIDSIKDLMIGIGLIAARDANKNDKQSNVDH